MGSRVLLLWLLYCGAVGAVRIEDFYPHGPSVDNTLPKDDDVSSPEIFLNTPIRFFGELQNSLFVNNNGILSFLIDIPIFFNVQFPLEYPVIAPLYTNVDTRKTGNVYYRETQNPDLLNKASYNVRRLYPNLAAQFSAKSLFIATWVDVGYYKEGSDKVNTYQVAISSDGEESFVELLYKDGGMQWLQGSGSGVGLPDARAQAGFVSPDGRLFSLKGSGTDQIKNVEKWTNSDVPGLFTFRIGQIGPNDNVEQPQTTESTDIDSLEHNSCMSSSTVCHSQAQCIDNESGFCCVCNEGYYGNGRTCLKDGIPLRVNGKISLDINGVKGKADLQAYIVTTDSRSYVALSKVPGELGSTLQLLVLFPNVIGWLFAKPVSGAKNGYQLTGGVFNHSLTIKYRHSAHSININQRFLGLDVFDQLKIEADISGEIPPLPEVNLSMPDYIQQLTRISPGALRSQSSHTIKVESTGQEYEMKTDQTIYFNEHCPLESLVLKLKTARNFISYEGTEKILRFASTAKVSKISEKDDPCLEGQVTCVANSSCLAEGDTFRCVCNPGFHTQYSNQGTDDYGCVDTNECELGTSTCAENAICINQVGSFSCQCMPGFSGNGHYCTEILAETPCQRNPALCNQPNSYCQIPGNLSTCDCNYGFQRYPLDEGFTCIDIDECQNPQACHVDAICQNTEGSFRCTCNPGYYGDGRDCRFIEENRQPCQAVVCDVNAECIEDPYEGPKCVCSPGYTGDGASYCNPEPKTVQGCNNCARDAFCQNNVCVCRQGFVGDGTLCFQGSQTTLKTCLNDTCWCPPGYASQDNPPLCILNNNLPPDTYFSTTVTPYDDVSCNVLNRCHQNAQCVKISSQEYKCECNAGFEGDGYDCSDVEVNCAEIDICDPHAYCDFNPSTSRGICRCEDGYKGDGVLCHKEIGCSSNTDCGSDSVCSFNPELDINECACMPGFSRFNGICYKEDDGSITSGCHICHTDAECIQNDVYGTAQCKCRSGFEGDGVTRCDYVTTCNELNNCSPTADCVYNHTYSTYQCQCRPGYEGDGLVCHPIENCQNNPSLCHPNAYCVQISHNDFNCQCKPGYVGNGEKCREEYKPTNADEFLLVNQGMATLKIPYRPTSTNPGQPIQLKTEQIAIGLTTDCVEGRVYWSDIVSQAIRSSTYNGLEVEDVSTEGIGSPEGLTIDWINRNIYWTDSTKDTINVANLDTKEKKVIVSQGLVNPRGIAVHPGRRKIFWSDWNRASPKLEVSQFDGSNRAVFVQGPAVQLPNSLAIDWQTDELCWADAGTKSIECIGITSLIRRTVVTNCSYPFGLTITSDKYYWTDWNTQKIESAWKSGGEKSQSLDVPLGGSGKLYGIAAVSSSCPYS